MSGCIDINGNRIEDALTYDKENNKANVNTTNTSYCYLYFSIKLPVFSEKILSNVSAYSDIEYVADGYRYVGLNPNNYVTFNNETWRIIGFFDGDQIGMTSGKYYVKLIKEEAIGAIAYDEDEDTELDWSKTTLYTYLNNEYYNTLLNDSKDMIVNAKWYYYISSVYDLGVSNREEAYINEKSSQSSTLYDAVGLIYPSDWAYAVPAVHGCNDANLASYFDESGCTSANWLASKADMWSIFLLGSEYKADRAYYISSFGLSYTSASLEFNIYPVVYLSSDVTIKGSGNGSETNKYELVL